ncbi:MAG: hypothetical protein WD894_21580 [Pirellulales bacterium]
MAAVSLKSAPSDARRSLPVASERRPRRRRRRWPVVVAIGLLLLYFAPSLVARTGLRDVPLRMVFDGIEGTIRSEGASLGWFSAVEYRGVEVHDHEGSLLLRVPTVTVDRTPLQLLAERRRLGTVVVQEPELHFVARDGDSNAEDVLLGWWNAPSSGPVEMELQVIEGTIELQDKVANEQWNMTALAASVGLAGDGGPAAWSAEGKVTDGQRKGLFTISSGRESNQAIQLKAEQIPLAMFRWLAARNFPGLQLAGDMTCDMVYQTAGASADEATADTDASTRQSVVGQIGVINLLVAGGPLRGDALRLADLMIKSDITRQGDRLEVKELAVDCELGRITAQGNIPVAAPRDSVGLAALAREAFALQGSIDLARLSRMLPETLRIRSDTQISDGTVRLMVASEAAAEEHRWHARVEASGLAATSAGKPVRWDQPVTIELAARESDAGVVVDRLECSSDFMKLSGQGSANELVAEATFDLDRLKIQFGQLIDFGEMQLAGEGQAQLQWKRDGEGVFRASATARLRSVLLGTSAVSIWREPDLTAELQASGLMPAATIERIDSAAVRLRAAGQSGATDELEVHLREPIAARDRGERIAFDKLPVIVHCSGNVAQWQARLAPWMDLSGLNLVGAAELHANLTWTAGAWHAHSLRGAVQQAQAGPLTFAAQGLYSQSDDAVRLDDVQVNSEAIKLRAKGQIDAVGGKTNVSLQGQTEYDWAALSKLLAPYFGNNVRAEGRDTRAFTVRGPIGSLKSGLKNAGMQPMTAASPQAVDSLLWIKPLTAQAGIGWQRADVFGLRLGPGDIAGTLADGVLQIKPVELAVSEGRVRLSPQIVLTPGPAELVHGRALVIERVRVTPEMTASWLKYVAPAVAEATETQGDLSLDLTGAKVPLYNPETASAIGRLDIHSLQVTPGPTARAIILLAEQIRALVERRPSPLELGRNPTLLKVNGQQIDFRMAGGRVHHQGMSMDIGSVTIRTNGWVAFDESMGLVAEVPIKAEWFGRNAVPAGLKDQTLQIPIGGTLRRPQVDPRAMQQVVALFAQNAARDLIEDQINKQFDRLFQPR